MYLIVIVYREVIIRRLLVRKRVKVATCSNHNQHYITCEQTLMIFIFTNSGKYDRLTQNQTRNGSKGY